MRNEYREFLERARKSGWLGRIAMHRSPLDPPDPVEATLTAAFLVSERGEWVCLWRDGTTLRRVRARVMTETWTTDDPELLSRNRLPSEQRRELYAGKR